MNFWFLPEGAEDDELIEDAGTTEQLERNKNKFLGDQETRANEKGILLAQMQGKYAVRKS
jgi:hypothetical protein